MLPSLIAPLASALLAAPTLVRATAYIRYPDSLPSDLTTDCANALLSDINCSANITRLLPNRYYPESFLDDLCTTDCNAALNQYETGVVSACGSQIYATNTTEGDIPVSTIPQLLRYYFNYTCLSSADGAGYCNVIAANAIGINANQSNLNSDSVQGGGNVSCSDCSLKSVQFLAGSPFYSNSGIKSAYSSLTSSCGATDYPLSTSTFTFASGTTTVATTTATATPSACNGTTYTIQAGDTCRSISKSQSVGTTWLLLDNDLTAYCADFPTSGSLCIQHQCSTYTVQTNDTCTSIASEYGITYAQILAWNPSFDLLCSNVNRSVGLEICVSSPGGNYTLPSSVTTTATASVATTTASVPTNAANGSLTDCAEWYEAQPGDYCNLVVLRYGLSLADFQILNPEVNENCTNLYAYESYCVEPVGDISNYPGAPGYISATTAASTVAYSSLPIATYIPNQYVPYNVSYANGTSSVCGAYVDGTDYNAINITGTLYSSMCELVTTVWDITTEQLYLWNPSLGNASLSTCSLLNETLYCVQQYASPTTTQSAAVALNTSASVPSNCKQYSFAGEGVTCDDLISYWGITMAEFVALNPDVGENCSNLTLDTYYCISTTNITVGTGTATTTVASTTSTASQTSSTVSVPGPTQSGIPANCDAYYVAQSGDSCSSIESKFNITDAQFHAWNPAVSSDCLSGFWADEAYCVGVTGSSTTSTITSSSVSSSTTTTSVAATTTSTVTTTSVTPPGPTQSGIPADCDAYAVAASGEGCYDFATSNGITLNQLYEWNPVLNNDCENFWVGEAYCIGVSA